MNSGSRVKKLHKTKSMPNSAIDIQNNEDSKNYKYIHGEGAQKLISNNIDYASNISSILSLRKKNSAYYKQRHFPYTGGGFRGLRKKKNYSLSPFYSVQKQSKLQLEINCSNLILKKNKVQLPKLNRSDIEDKYYKLS